MGNKEGKMRFLKDVKVKPKENTEEPLTLTREDIETLNANLEYLQQLNERLPGAVVSNMKPVLMQRDEYFNDRLIEISTDFNGYVDSTNRLQKEHIEELKRIGKVVARATNIILDAIPKGKNDNTNNVKPEKLKLPSGFKGWMKFLFYDCPKYSLSKPVRRKFLCQMGETCRLLATVWAVVFLLIIANDNYHLREKVVELQRTEQKYKLLRKASKAVKSWSDKADEIEFSLEKTSNKNPKLE